MTGVITGPGIARKAKTAFCFMPLVTISNVAAQWGLIQYYHTNTMKIQKPKPIPDNVFWDSIPITAHVIEHDMGWVAIIEDIPHVICWDSSAAPKAQQYL